MFPPPPTSSHETYELISCTVLTCTRVLVYLKYMTTRRISRISPSWVRAACKKTLCLLHYLRKMKCIHSFIHSLCFCISVFLCLSVCLSVCPTHSFAFNSYMYYAPCICSRFCTPLLVNQSVLFSHFITIHCVFDYEYSSVSPSLIFSVKFKMYYCFLQLRFFFFTLLIYCDPSVSACV